MVEQVREATEKANQRVYGDRVTVHLRGLDDEGSQLSCENGPFVTD